MRKPWTGPEEKLLLENQNQKVSKIADILEAHTGHRRTDAAIWSRLYSIRKKIPKKESPVVEEPVSNMVKIPLRKVKSSRKHWSKDELLFLKNNPYRSNEELAKLINKQWGTNRTPESIGNAFYRLGWSSSANTRQRLKNQEEYLKKSSFFSRIKRFFLSW